MNFTFWQMTKQTLDLNRSKPTFSQGKRFYYKKKPPQKLKY